MYLSFKFFYKETTFFLKIFRTLHNVPKLSIQIFWVTSCKFQVKTSWQQISHNISTFLTKLTYVGVLNINYFFVKQLCSLHI